MICGASRGWLALMDELIKSLSLVNPFTGGEFSLPPTPNQLLFDVHDCDDSDLDSSLCARADGQCAGDVICGRL
ncbi:putative F-box protein SKIP23-like [Cocos nucifera]|nr:putative F-box protein SKIP23-like [Cocos nucifera]